LCYRGLGVSAECTYVDDGFTDDERVAAAEWRVRFAQTGGSRLVPE
jgi:hypothetical protein